MGTVAVTGGQSGMGAATVQLLRSAGNRVISVDRSTGADVQVDLSTRRGRMEAVAGIERSCDQLDGIVLSAGVVAGDPAQIVAVNFFGVRHVLEGIRQRLAAAKEAKVVVISSNAAATRPDVDPELLEALLADDESEAARLSAAGTDRDAYAASKFALIRWTRQIAVSDEWAGAGIRANIVCPGWVRTPMFERATSDPNVDAWRRAQPLPAGRVAEAEEIAALCQVLLSPIASYLIGQVIYADGGVEAALRWSEWPPLAPRVKS